MRLLVAMVLMASMTSIALGILITGSRGGSEEAKQERDSKMVKNFQPFSHPAMNKYKNRDDDSTDDVIISSPISRVQWIGGMLLPIFGPLGIFPKPVYNKDEAKEGFQPSFIILGFTIVVGGFIAKMYGGSDKGKGKPDKEKHERERNQREECGDKTVTKKNEINKVENGAKKSASRISNGEGKVKLEGNDQEMGCKEEKKDLKVVKYVSDIMKASAINVDKDANELKLADFPRVEEDVKDTADTTITQKFKKENDLTEQKVKIPEKEKSTQKESPTRETIPPKKSIKFDVSLQLSKSNSESSMTSTEEPSTPSKISSEELISITKKIVDHSEPLENSITLTKEIVSQKNGSVTLEEEVLNLSNETAALLEETITPFTEKIVEATKSDKKPKGQLSNENHYAKDEELEDSGYIGPLKTFRISKYPKTHAADLNLSLNEDYLIVSMVVQLQSTAQMKSGIKAEEADIGIEGANISRLRITEVKEKDELELTSKTMTIKVIEEMSKVIEDMDQVMEDIEKQEIKNVSRQSDVTKNDTLRTAVWDNKQFGVKSGTSHDDLKPCVQDLPAISEEMKLQLRKMEDLIKEILRDIQN